MQFSNNGYYSAMDRIDNSQFFVSNEPTDLDEEGNPIVSDDALNFTPQDIGLTTNPTQNPLESLKAQIKQGAGKIEIGFMGQGKGSAQSPTPESVGAGERQDMRELLKINNMKTSTHAAVHANSLAGFGERGFSNAARSQALKEINKAIHFAGEATKGGAIVFHMHEWQRPLSEINDKTGAKFSGHIDEDKDATFYTVDNRTGELIHAVKKDQIIYRPVYKTAKHAGLVGQKDSKTGKIFQEDDLVDRDGNYLKKNGSFDDLEKRVPLYDQETKKFEVQPLNWDDLKNETSQYNKENNSDLSVAEYQARVQVENQLVSIKGQQGYHMNLGRSSYSNQEKEYQKLKEEFDLYKKLKSNLPKDEHWKLDAQFGSKFNLKDDETVEDAYNENLESIRGVMGYVGEIGATEEAKYLETKERWKHIEDAEKYGLKKSADTIALAGISAMQTYSKNKDKYGLDEPLYVAPENWNQSYYGSHPDEMRKIVKASREAMVHKLKGKYSEEEAKKLAEKHIKATLDIGHLNTLRYNFQGSDEEFDKWMLDQSDKLVKDGIVGHIHLSDNFGFDDEHVTPGQGNIPMKKFLKNMEARGMKDIILEVGSFNANTAYLDTLSFSNSPVYGVGARQRFAQTKNAHFGYNAPSFFIAGAYAPSNEWKPWTDVPLE